MVDRYYVDIIRNKGIKIIIINICVLFFKIKNENICIYFKLKNIFIQLGILFQVYEK